MDNYKIIDADVSVNARIIDAEVTISNEIVEIDASVSTPILHSDYPEYEGSYEVKPDWESTTLQTKNTKMAKNVVVAPIQLESVSNLSGGRTVYIGGLI